MTAHCRDLSLETATDVSHLSVGDKTFTGSDLEFVELEIYAARYWSRQQLKQAVYVTQKAWFDYRMIHPVKRVMLFAHHYRRARERAFARVFSRRVKMADDIPFTKKTHRSGQTSRFTNMMFVVDEMGIPYDHFFDEIIHWLMQEGAYKTWDQSGWGDIAQGVPLLTHMTHGKAIIATQKAFDERCKVKLPLPLHPAYKVEKWAGTPAQKDCIAWLCAQTKNRGPMMNHALKHLIIKGYLHEREILRRFGPDTVREVRAITV